MDSLVKCAGSYNTHEAPFAVLYVRSRIDNVNVKVFNMITGINTRRWRPDVKKKNYRKQNLVSVLMISGKNADMNVKKTIK